MPLLIEGDVLGFFAHDLRGTISRLNNGIENEYAG
jgi:hypothetical protein